jgi:DNA-binding CsgD family transcriptional regulator
MPVALMPGRSRDEFEVALRAVEISQRVSNLPAVATLDWLDRAAACLVGTHAGLVAGLLVGEVSDSGEIRKHEAHGVSVGRPAEKIRLVTGEDTRANELRCRLESLHTLSVEVSPGRREHPVCVRLSEALGQAWRASIVGDLLRPLGARDALVCVASIPGSGGRRAVAAILGECSESSVFDGALLRAAMKFIAERAELALGREAFRRSSWVSEREQRVLELLILGMSVPEIAAELGRSPHTVNDHVKSLHRKLATRSRGELIARALGHLGICRAREPEASRPHDDERHEPATAAPVRAVV